MDVGCDSSDRNDLAFISTLDNTSSLLVLISLIKLLMMFANVNSCMCGLGTCAVCACVTDQGTPRCAGAAPVAERTEREP